MANNYTKKQMCGLWHAHVVPSEHNDNGKCECIGCFGTHCHGCAKYRALSEKICGMFEKTVCQLCREHQEKTR